MLFSDVSGRKVVSTTTADTVGKVEEVVIDPASRAVAAFLLKKTDNGDVIIWGNLTGVGDDALTVRDASLITAAEGQIAELAAKEKRALGKRVLATSGDELGKLTDVDFDPRDGSITTLRVGDTDVPGERLVGIGSYAVVVRTG